uniref:Transposase n=1 Tax=Panagrellus redivivus TaxID=6233 RepID=A0A7E4UUG3_PANRE
MTRRHNAVLDRLTCTIPKGNDHKLFINQSIRDCDSSLRPDIVWIDEKTKNVTILDVTIPFEGSTTSFQEARKRKQDKYGEIETHFKAQGYKTFNNAFVIGSLGSYDAANEVCIKRLRISHKYATLMKRLMVSDVIRWSRDIYTKHVTGIRQYH